jgi:DNA repair exonuclease SbcCD ATPase subunit/DNA repair exonuclease SbcCD nuclease subunit
LFRRHEEYELAFDKLYNDIRSKKLEDFVIVLAGDIVHAKTDMSPEMVEVTSKFLKNIADIAPTILIAGNHDCNLANTNRLDALTPLVNNLQHPQLHYIKDSAVVTVADTQFAIMSIFDEHYEWPTAKELTAEHKIALYHGPVHGAVTDINFVITNRHVNVNTFDGFDMVLLGDIHKPAQILKEKNPIIAYPGSLIQQHHGETLDPHGWCLWDVPSRAFEFVHLENDYGYVTLEVYNGQITYPANMPKNARLRLFTGEMDNTDVKKLITTIRNKFNIIEMSVNKNRKQLNVNTSSTHVHDTVDLTDVSVQNKLIHDWLGQKYSLLDDSILVAIEKINKDLNSKIVHDDHSRNINWRPLVFKFSNMFSYGEDNEINFSDMKGLYGIFAANASGKSSIMDAIMFCLYDKTPRAFKGDHILNNRKDSFTCELTFEINHEVFGIKRVGTRKKNGDVKVDASFWKALPDGSKQNLNGEDRRDTNANIRSYVGTYEDFVMTALSSQNSNALFIDKSHSERKDLLIQFMGLNVFDKLFDAAHGESKEISGILKRFKKSDVTDKLVEVHANLEKAATRIDEFESTKELYNSQLIDAETRYKTIYATKRPVPQTSGNWEDLQSKLTIARKKLKTAQEDVAIAEYALTSNKKDLEDVRLEFANYDMGALSEANTKWNELHVLLKKKNAHMSIIDTQINEKINFKAKLEGYKYNSNCAVCVENNRVVIEDIKFVNEELDTLQAGKIIEESVIAKILDELRGLQDDQDRFEEGYQLKQTVYECSQTVYAATTTLQNAKNTLEKAEIVLSKIQDEIDIYKTNEENILYNQSVDAQLQAVHKDIANIKQKVSNVDGELRRLYGDLSVLTAKQVDLKNELKEAEELEITYEAYNHYMMAVGRDGVPYDLMSKAIPQIESEINNILSQIVDFSVSLEVDGKNINGKLSYDNDRIWPLENSSGMERFITSLAIRVALLNASNLPKSNMFIIDEGFGVLDADHLHSMQTLFNLLKTQFDTILIVSHLETARDMVDNLIEIKKDDGYSRISI